MTQVFKGSRCLYHSGKILGRRALLPWYLLPHLYSASDLLFQLVIDELFWVRHDIINQFLQVVNNQLQLVNKIVRNKTCLLFEGQRT